MEAEKPKTKYTQNSLSAQVFQYIEEKILTQIYPRNYVLNEVTIAKELGVSRTPVREAVKQLEMDGLVYLEQNKGAVVLGLSDQDMGNILVVRAFLEGLCAKWATGTLNGEEFQRLEEIVDLQRFYCERGSYRTAWEAGHEFHKIIYQKSRVRQVYNLLVTYHKYSTVRLSCGKNAPFQQLALHAVDNHKKILDAMQSGDSALSEKLMAEHLQSTFAPPE